MKLDKETILKLYYGELNPLDMEMTEEEYKICGGQFLKNAQKFSEKLSPELRKEFQNLCDMEMKADELLHRDGFCKGFQTGLRLTAEALLDSGRQAGTAEPDFALPE